MAGFTLSTDSIDFVCVHWKPDIMRLMSICDGVNSGPVFNRQTLLLYQFNESNTASILGLKM